MEGRTAPSRALPPPPSLPGLVVAAGLVLGLALRVWMVASPLGPPDADEAVAGLMARDVLHGRFETFFWGQEYGGSQEALVLAALFRVGVPTRAAMELLALVGAAGVAVLVWRIARRLTTPAAAAVAGLAAWVGTPAVLWMTTKARGFYAATALLGLAAVLGALRYRERPGTARAAAVGLLAGLAWWASPQSLYLLVPAALVVAVPIAGRRRLVHAGAALAAAAAGAAPWIYTNLRTGFASFGIPASVPDTGFGWRLGRFLREGLAVLLGFRVPVEGGWALAPAGQAAYAVALLVLAAAVVAVAWRTPHRWLAAAVAAYPLLFAAIPTSTYTRDPRYLSFLFPLLALLAAVVAGRWWRRPVVVGGLVALYLAAAVGTAALVRIGDRAAGHHHLVPPPVGALVAELRVTGVEAAFADYWVAYRIPLVTEGRIRASALTDPRSPELERATRSEPRPPYVVFAGECPDRQVQRALADLGVGYGRVVVGAYAVITPERRVMPEQLVREWAEQRGRAPAGAAPAHSCLGR